MCNHNVLNYVLFPRQRKKQKKLSAKKKKEERKDDGELLFLLILTEDEKGFYCSWLGSAARVNLYVESNCLLLIFSPVNHFTCMSGIMFCANLQC